MARPARHISLLGFEANEESFLRFVLSTKPHSRRLGYRVHTGRTHGVDAFVIFRPDRKCVEVSAQAVQDSGRCGEGIEWIVEALRIVCSRRRGPKKLVTQDETNVHRNPE